MEEKEKEAKKESAEEIKKKESLEKKLKEATSKFNSAMEVTNKVISEQYRKSVYKILGNVYGEVIRSALEEHFEIIKGLSDYKKVQGFGSNITEQKNEEEKEKKGPYT